MSLPERLKICGRWWALRFTPHLRAHRGKCDPPDASGKAILIDSSLRGEELLEVLIHEQTHAGNWNLAEEWVEVFARDVARNLWRIGYRGPQ